MSSDTSLIFNIVARDRASAALGRVKEKIDAASAAIGAAGAAALGVGLMTHMDVTAAGDKLATQLGLTEAESERIGGIAGSLYGNAYGDSMETVNMAVGSVMSSIKGMADASSADLETASAAALNFATAFDIDVQRAVQSVGTLLNTGLVEDSTEAFDIITAASQRVPAHLREDVLDASDEYGQFFASLGYDGEQAFSLLVDASEKGMFGIDKAGDAIKEFTIRSTDMSQASKDAYKAIGLNAHEMANDILTGGDDAQEATQKVIDGLLGIKDPAKQANTAIALFGTPLEDLNTAEIPAFLESLKGASGSMDDFSGSAKEMDKTLNDNTAVALETFKRKAMLALGEVAGKLAEFGIAHQQYVVPLGIGLGVLAGIILTVKAGMIVWATAQAVWNAATATATAIQWAYNAALAANPYTLIIIAIVALVAAIVAIATKTTWFQDIWKGMTKGISKAWDWVKEKISQGFNFIKNLFLNFSGPGLIIKHFGSIKNAVGNAMGWVQDKVGWGIGKAKGFIRGLKEMPGKVVGWFAGLGGDIGNAFKNGFKGAVNWIISAWNGFELSIPGFSLPGPLPDFGGMSIGTPDIPLLARGGMITRGGMAMVGERGPELLHLPRGAGVQPLTRGGGSSAHVVIELRSDDEATLQQLRRAVRVRGGNVQVVLGRG